MSMNNLKLLGRGRILKNVTQNQASQINSRKDRQNPNVANPLHADVTEGENFNFDVMFQKEINHLRQRTRPISGQNKTHQSGTAPVDDVLTADVIHEELTQQDQQNQQSMSGTFMSDRINPPLGQSITLEIDNKKIVVPRKQIKIDFTIGGKRDMPVE